MKSKKTDNRTVKYVEREWLVMNYLHQIHTRHATEERAKKEAASLNRNMPIGKQCYIKRVV